MTFIPEKDPDARKRTLAELLGGGLHEDELKKTAEELAKELDELIDDGLHLLAEGTRLFLATHPEWSAEEKTARIERFGKLDADLRKLVRETEG
jgi:hypothetical protein